MANSYRIALISCFVICLAILIVFLSRGSNAPGTDPGNGATDAQAAQRDAAATIQALSILPPMNNDGAGATPSAGASPSNASTSASPPGQVASSSTGAAGSADSRRTSPIGVYGSKSLPDPVAPNPTAPAVATEAAPQAEPAPPPSITFGARPAPLARTDAQAGDEVANTTDGTGASRAATASPVDAVGDNDILSREVAAYRERTNLPADDDAPREAPGSDRGAVADFTAPGDEQPMPAHAGAASRSAPPVEPTQSASLDPSRNKGAANARPIASANSNDKPGVQQTRADLAKKELAEPEGVKPASANADATQTKASVPAAAPAAAPTTPRDPRPAVPSEYKIAEGDTFASLALRYYGSEKYWVDIQEANTQLDPKRLRPGLVIKLPAYLEVVAATDPARADVPAADTRPAAPARPDAAAPAANTKPKTHLVQPGDRLWTIAQRYYGDGNQWTRIYRANRQTIGPNPNRLPAGKQLVIPPPEAAGE